VGLAPAENQCLGTAHNEVGVVKRELTRVGIAAKCRKAG
jgi:hypothetical protein